MADDEKKTFMQESQEYADMYEKALADGGKAILEVSAELIARGIKTKDQIIADAKQFGIDIKDATIAKALQVKGIVLDATGKVVQAGKDAKAWVDGKVEAGQQWVDGKVQAGKQWVEDRVDDVRQGYQDAKTWTQGKVQAGKQWVGDRAHDVADAAKTGAAMTVGAGLLAGKYIIKGAKTVGEKGKEVYRAGVDAKNRAVAKAQALWGKVKGKVQEGKAWVEGKVDAGKQWVDDRVDDVRQGYQDAKTWTQGKVQAGKQWVDDRVTDVKEGYDTAKQWVGDRAHDVADAAKTGAAMTVGAGLLAGKYVIKGAKTVGEKGKEVYRAGVDAKNRAVAKAQALWGKVKGKVQDARAWVDGKVEAGQQWVDGKVQAGKEWVEDRVDDVRQGYQDAKAWTQGKVEAGKQWVDDRVTDVKEGYDTAKQWVGDRAHDVADAARTGAAMTVGAGLLAGKYVIKGAKTVEEKGKKVYRAGVDAKNRAVAKAQALWGKVKGKVQAGKAWVDGKVQAGKEWVTDKAETAALYGMEAADAVKRGARAVKTKAEDVILDGAIAVEDAKDWVEDKAETVAIGAMLAADKVKDAARTGAAMTMGAAILGKDLVVKGVRKVGEKGKEVYRAGVDAKDRAVAKAQGLWGKIKTATHEKIQAGKEWVDGKVQAGKDWVEDRVTDVREGYQDAKEWVGDKIQDAGDRIQDARTGIVVKTNTTIASATRGVSGFFKNLGSVLEAKAVARDEKAKEAQQTRDEQKKMDAEGR